MRRLRELGFEKAGSWSVEQGQLVFRLDRYSDSSNILYAFVTGEEVKYIGKTTQLLRSRMYGYQKPGGSQLTNIRNHTNIKAMLEDGAPVDIWAFPDAGLLSYGGFHINLAAGLEDSLIASLNPQWNGGDTRKETDLDSPISAPQIEVQDQKETETQPRAYSRAASEAKDISLRPNFIFALRSTYYKTGFFNVPVDFDRYLAGDGATIEIQCAGAEGVVHGHINRTANAGGTARIMGGVNLKRWFQENFGVDQPIRVVVVSPTHIQVRRG